MQLQWGQRGGVSLSGPEGGRQTLDPNFGIFLIIWSVVWRLNLSELVCQEIGSQNLSPRSPLRPHPNIIIFFFETAFY